MIQCPAQSLSEMFRVLFKLKIRCKMRELDEFLLAKLVEWVLFDSVTEAVYEKEVAKPYS